MGDRVEKQVGNRKYWVCGLEELSGTIAAERSRMSDLVDDRLTAAEDALKEWRGPHAERFVEQVNGVLADMVTFELKLRNASNKCSAFPEEPPGGSRADDNEYVRVWIPNDEDGVVAGDPPVLNAYVDAADEQDGKYAGMADEVTTDDLSAEVSVQRGLTADERRERAEDMPEGLEHELDTMKIWPEPEDCDVEEVFGLPDLSDEAEQLKTDSKALSVWVAAVADAFKDSNQGRLDLLLEHPELAGFLDDDPATDGDMNGEGALAVMLANFDAFDTAAGRGDQDGIIGLPDLEAIAGNEDLPGEQRAAAQYLMDNRLFLSQVSIASDAQTYEVSPEGSEFTKDDVETFLQLNGALRAISLNFRRLDTAYKDDEPDGHVSVNDMQAILEDPDAPGELKQGVRFLLDNPELTQRLSAYEFANSHRFETASMGVESYPAPEIYGDPMPTDPENRFSPTSFNYEGVLALAVDQQAFGSDPEAAHQFVSGLPVADSAGNGGLDITLTSEEGVRALANSALRDADGWSEQHGVIAHLPETTAWTHRLGAVEQNGGVRNELITGFYDLLDGEMDGIFAGDLAGNPTAPGHPGANWATFGQWASLGARPGITGDAKFEYGPISMSSLSSAQAAADGNQWIFNDVGGRFATFIEMYDNNSRPTDLELERFFDNNFDDGDGTAQTAFAAYVAATEETDPLRKQQLMYQGNALIGLHEQAGIQTYIEALTPVDWEWVDRMVTDRVAEMRVGDDVLDLHQDVPERSRDNNLLEPDALRGLDTEGRGPGSFMGRLDFEDLAGIEATLPDASQSIREIMANGGTPDPNLNGTGADRWSDWDERMNFILNYFHQYHTDPELFDTAGEPIGLEGISWLDEDARPGAG